jgi:hypothetical protein
MPKFCREFLHSYDGNRNAPTDPLLTELHVLLYTRLSSLVSIYTSYAKMLSWHVVDPQLSSLCVMPRGISQQLGQIFHSR